ncbi:MAG: DNA polymerase/3'-5' exonuclease PolX [Bacteroidetes bacterium]|nr:DNA polymerase/3'-5' exonuclease PolX [Bacteroidota bacterium]
MTTEDIADALELTAKLMELHNENPFKIKAISAAAYKLSKTRVSLEGLTVEELTQIEGIGKGIAEKIVELNQTQSTKELSTLLAKTPQGLIEMLHVKGLGPKKVRQLWQELDIETVTELLYACNENRLVELKGFGAKTQAEIKKSIEFKLNNSGKYHYSYLEKAANQLLDELRKTYPLVSLTGEIYRRCEILEQIDILVGSHDAVTPDPALTQHLPVQVLSTSPETFYSKLVETSSANAHLEGIGFEKLTQKEFASEQAVYESLGIQYVEPELREGLFELEKAASKSLPELVGFKDLKGVLHNHSTYSDGINTLEEMAVYCKESGYEYLGICDHSQTAVYAQGLKVEKIMEQHAEIEKLNAKLAPFKIFKGIESDILGDGSLDYPEEVLKTFDIIVASVHSNLKMDMDKATARLIKAIENPYTTILGHPTGRLLLGRPGYPIDHKKVIDACAANGVVMELNAHPYRLDIDWRWIPYCLEKNVMISINPDAHQREGYHDMYYGTLAARKGMLTKAMCLNAMDLGAFEAFLATRKK